MTPHDSAPQDNPFDLIVSPDAGDDSVVYAFAEYVEESQAAGDTLDALARRLAESALDLDTLGSVGACFSPKESWQPVDRDRLSNSADLPGTPNPFEAEHEVVQRAVALRLGGAPRPASGPDGGGEPDGAANETRRRVLVEAGPHAAREADALADYERYKAALTARFGAPSAEDERHPHPDLPDRRVTTWEAGAAGDGPDEVELSLSASVYNYDTPWSLHVYKVYVREPTAG